jgi:hypothetical protein
MITIDGQFLYLVKRQPSMFDFCGPGIFKLKETGFVLCSGQVQGGTMRDSFLVNGVAFKKTFSYAGFEQQPKQFNNPKILRLNLELELKSEKENAEVR